MISGKFGLKFSNPSNFTNKDLLNGSHKSQKSNKLIKESNLPKKKGSLIVKKRNANLSSSKDKTIKNHISEGFKKTLNNFKQGMKTDFKFKTKSQMK